MTSLAERLSQVQQRIRQACQMHKKTAPRLLAVSKTRSAEEVRAAFDLGLRHFGENYVQEAVAKQQALTDLAIDWHFIGPIQSNKARTIAENFDWVHSVDRLKVAQKLNQFCPAGKSLQVCLQVNIDNSPTKSGVLAHALPELIGQCLELPQIKLRGLMAIPDPTSARESFHRLAELLQSARQAFPDLELDCLSMGMSGDLEDAIAEGSTIVRIGTDIFGPRNQPQAKS